ncbi:MAG: M35 family metallo-endopeptidase [Ekhidna sp.]
MKRTLFLFSILFSISCFGQPLGQLTIKGDYTTQDSIQIAEAYIQARKAVGLLYQNMISIRDSRTSAEKDWIANKAFSKWLGSAESMNRSFRRIKKIHSKFNKSMTLFVTKKNRGRCTGWISAWTLPYGQIKIKLCEDFFMYRTHLQEKVLVHEIGHETGLLSHHRIHGCRAALRAATNDPGLAKRSTENYAWLAVSYLGIECTSPY